MARGRSPTSPASRVLNAGFNCQQLGHENYQVNRLLDVTVTRNAELLESVATLQDRLEKLTALKRHGKKKATTGKKKGAKGKKKSKKKATEKEEAPAEDGGLFDVDLSWFGV